VNEGSSVSEQNGNDQLRVLSPQQLLAWAEDNTEIMRFRTSRDVLPGGYPAALAPVLVDWRSSDPYGDEPFVILRNINSGGNPLDRTTVLQSVRVRLSGIDFAEFMLVPSTRGGLYAPSHHVQLRFAFKPGCEPQLLNLAESRTGTDASVPDLILSWESWRPMGEGFSLVKGLDARYGLTLRAFAGPQRFLEDSLRGRDWFSYRLSMPGGEAGLVELAKVAVALGDGVARHTVADLLEQGEENWLEHAPEAAEELSAQKQWSALQERIQDSRISDRSIYLDAEHTSYHSVLRSCATLSRYTVLTTAQRMVNRGITEGVDLNQLPEPVLREAEPWMAETAKASLTGLFLQAPLALGYFMRHPESVPVKIPDELARAGLVESSGGRPRLIQYSRDEIRPYGRYGINPQTRD
jgi:hypothetical protein